MNKKIIFLILIIVLFFIFILTPRGWKAKLVGPEFIKSQSTPVPSANNVTPKIIRYDRSTDLRKELEQINPQVLDSDFE